jgi:hypothetical protein
MKTLKIDTLYTTKVGVTLETSLQFIFKPNTSIFLKLIDGTWVLYQLKFREFHKADSLEELLNATFQVDLPTFYVYAQEMSFPETKLINSIFESNDNFNLDMSIMYKLF